MIFYRLIKFLIFNFSRTGSYDGSLSLHPVDQYIAPLTHIELKFEGIPDMIPMKTSNSLLAMWQLFPNKMHEQTNKDYIHVILFKPIFDL